MHQLIDFLGKTLLIIGAGIMTATILFASAIYQEAREARRFYNKEKKNKCKRSQ